MMMKNKTYNKKNAFFFFSCQLPVKSPKISGGKKFGYQKVRTVRFSDEIFSKIKDVQNVWFLMYI